MSIHPPEPTVMDTSPLSLDEDIRLHFEVQRLYATEARLLDQHRYADWLELLADDLHYWAPVRTNRLRRQQTLADGAPGEVAIFDETKASLAWRIRRFDSGMAWAEDPPSRTRHLITNVLVQAAGGELRDLARDAQAVFDVGALLFRRRAARQHAFFSEEQFEEPSRVNERHAFACKLFCDSADKAVRVFRRQPRQHPHHSQIGQSVEPKYLMVFDLPCHYHVRHLLAFEEVNKAAKLTDAYPFDSCRMLLYLRLGLFLDGRDHHIRALRARSFKH